MKKALLIVGFLACVIALASCKKDTLHFVKSKITGSWELRDIQGGFLGVVPDVTPGNGKIVKFSDSEYQFYSRGQLTGSGTYTLTKMDTYDGTYPESALFLDSDPYPFARVSITKNTLTMYVGAIAADGYIAKYLRQ